MRPKIILKSALFSLLFAAVFISMPSNISWNSITGIIQSRAQEASPDIEPRAAEILQNMSYFLGSKSTYTFKANAMFDAQIDSGQKIQYSAEEKIYLKKPDKFNIEYVSDLGGYKLWYDSGQLTMLEVPSNQFALAQLPGTVDQGLKKLLEEYDFSPALSSLLFINTYSELTKNVTSGSYYGASKVFGVLCEHLGFVQDDIDWQIWIESGKRQIPRKIVITYKNLPGQPQFIAFLNDWVIDKSITDFVFNPNIPDPNQRVEMSQIVNKPQNKIGSIRTQN